MPLVELQTSHNGRWFEIILSGVRTVGKEKEKSIPKFEYWTLGETLKTKLLVT
jgi:hypothetical protein